MKKRFRKKEKKKKTPRNDRATGRTPIYRSPVARALGRHGRLIQRYFVTGALVWVPAIITLWVSWWVFKNIGLSFEVVIKRTTLAIQTLGNSVSYLSFLKELRYIPGLGFLLVIALFMVTGYLTRYLIAQKAIHAGELLLQKIPLVSRIYFAVRQIRDVFVNRNGTLFQQAALVEYPRPGIYAVGFITAKPTGVLQETIDKDYTTVFVPTTPNPTSGFLLFFPTAEVVLLDISIEDAMKLIISGGAFMPDERYIPTVINEENDDDEVV